MTKQKKFKKRVRARMSEDGTRYTEARGVEEAEADPIDRTARDLISLRDLKDTKGILAKLVAFHEQHVPLRPALCTLQTLVLEALWPAQVPFLHTDPKTGREVPSVTAVALRHLLSAWVEGDSLEGVRTVVPSAKHVAATLAYRHSLLTGKGLPATEGTPEQGDDAFFAGEASGFDPAGEEVANLAEIWPVAPDVREWFGPLADPAVSQAARVHEETEEVRLARLRDEQEPEAPGVLGDVHEMMAGLAREIRRLRERMLERGINPDA